MMLSNETIENIRDALEIKIAIAFLDETRAKFNEFICDLEDGNID